MSPEQNTNSQELNDLVLTSEEKPFSTEKSAKSALKQRKLDGTHEVVNYGEGFALKMKSQNNTPVQDPPKDTTPEKEPEAPTQSEEPKKTQNARQNKNLIKIVLAKIDQLFNFGICPGRKNNFFKRSFKIKEKLILFCFFLFENCFFFKGPQF